MHSSPHDPTAWRSRLDRVRERARQASSDILEASFGGAQEYLLNQLRRRVILPSWMVSTWAFNRRKAGLPNDERGAVLWRDSVGVWHRGEGAFVSGQFHTNELWRRT